MQAAFIVQVWVWINRPNSVLLLHGSINLSDQVWGSGDLPHQDKNGHALLSLVLIITLSRGGSLNMNCSAQLFLYKYMQPLTKMAIKSLRA